MDWFLGISTYLVNANLGWKKGVWWAWVLWGTNALVWQGYIMSTGQWGFTPLNLITAATGFVNGWRAYWQTHGERASNHVETTGDVW